MKETVKNIKLLGVTLTIRSDKDNAYVNEVLSYYQKRINEAKEKVSSNDRLKISILAALNIVDELFKERMDAPPTDNASIDNSDEVKSITERILEQIDEILTE